MVRVRLIQTLGLHTIAAWFLAYHTQKCGEEPIICDSRGAIVTPTIPITVLLENTYGVTIGQQTTWLSAKE